MTKAGNPAGAETVTGGATVTGSATARAARTIFLVGRVRPGMGEVIVMDGPAPPPFPGPWTLRALIRSPPRAFSLSRQGNGTVH
jgi:hypothetical protein